jgi:DNA-binding winged helix-turn-helix (wHTH) protein
MSFSLKWCDYRSRIIRTPAGPVRLSPQQMDVLSAFVMRHRLHLDELVEIMWGDRDDGGPMSGKTLIRQAISVLNRHLAPWRIRWDHGGGMYELAYQSATEQGNMPT